MAINFTQSLKTNAPVCSVSACKITVMCTPMLSITCLAKRKSVNTAKLLHESLWRKRACSLDGLLYECAAKQALQTHISPRNIRSVGLKLFFATIMFLCPYKFMGC